MQIPFSGRLLVLCLLLAALAVSLPAQNSDQMSYASAASSKFVNLPVLPACVTFSAQRGDPTKGPAMLLLKFKSGCTIPWHWHTANENLMMVSGKGKAEMKSGGGAQTMSPGDYMFLPAKQGHRFTCISSCLVFDYSEAAFDIHYIGADGKEIPPEQAFKPMAKPPAKKP